MNEKYSIDYRLDLYIRVVNVTYDTETETSESRDVGVTRPRRDRDVSATSYETFKTTSRDVWSRRSSRD